MSTSKEEAYKWLEEVKSGDRIPADHQWRLVVLLKDMNERIKAIEERQNPEKHNEVSDENIQTD